MRKVILYIATSLDGYIAQINGDIDWLFTDFNESDYGYTEFYNSIDTTLIGNSTSRQILTFGEFPYTEKKNFVFTRNKTVKPHPGVSFILSDIGEFVRKLKSEYGKNIWLVGGGQINTVLLKAKLIDELIISIHPVLLGNGIPLFEKHEGEFDFTLIKNTPYSNGLVQMVYNFS